jgi:hypothetical protein
LDLAPGDRPVLARDLAAGRGCGNVHTLGCVHTHSWVQAAASTTFGDAGRRGAGAGRRAAMPGCGRPGVGSGRRPGPPAAWVHHAAVNTIALRWETTYHGCMTTLQAPKRAGYMNPISQLKAALMGGMVAV